MEFRLLGEMELWAAGQLLDVGPPRQQAVLAALAVDAGRPVAIETLIDRIWADTPPLTVRNVVYSHVSRIRQLMRQASTLAGVKNAVRIERRHAGYLLDVDSDLVDLHRFRRLVEQGRDSRRADTDRADALTEALGLWRGPPLACLGGEWATQLRDSWYLRRLDAVMQWAEVELRLGHPAVVIHMLPDLVTEYPLVEPLEGLLMRALHAAGRDTEALDRYAALRQQLADELGTDPSAELSMVHQAILRGELPSPAQDLSDGAPLSTTGAHRTLTERPTTAATHAFGRTLKRLRLAAGLTQEALADRAGVSPRAVSDLERHPQRTPRLETVTLLADALRLQPEQRTGLLTAARPLDSALPAAGLPPIPRPLTPLIGRTGIVPALVNLVERRDIQLLTLTGPGGVGKTRLALEILSQVASKFTDGAVFVDLAPMRAESLVIATVAQQFGLDQRATDPLPERLAAALRDKRVLLLLDNFEHLVEARTDLLALLTNCPGVTALVTSRVPLRVRGEREYRIAPLKVPPHGVTDSPASTLFVERVRAVGVELPAGDAPAVAEICRRLEGLPLAIELAAARARLLPPAALLSQLEHRLQVLVGGAHDLPDRQKTMRDAIDWSYQLLSVPAKSLFRRLCVFVGGCSLPAAEKIDTPPSLWDNMAELIDANLITAPAPRIAMLETIREYGLEQLRAVGELNAVARKHTEYFLALAESGERSAIDLEHDNLRTALSRTLNNADTATALRFCGALWAFWDERGYLAEGLQYTRTTLASAFDQPNVAARLAVLTGAATMAIGQSSFDEAAAWCEELVALARQGTDRQALVTALNTRGLLARLQDRYADAVTDHEEALALAEAGTNQAGLAAALIGLSYNLFLTGASERADELAERGLTATRETGGRRELVDALLLLSWQAMHAGQHKRTDTLATEALKLTRATTDTGKHAEGLRILGTNAQLQNQHERANALYEECYAVYRDRGDIRVADQILVHLGHVALTAGNLSRAHKLGKQALETARRLADQWSIAMSTTLLGQLRLTTGEIERARTLLLESADAFQIIGNPIYLSWCLEGLAGVAVAEQRFDLAAELCAAHDALLARIAAKLPPMHPSAYQQTISTMNTALGTADVTTATTQHRPLDELIATAGRKPRR